MEEYSIDITNGCEGDIRNIVDYISSVFLDKNLANKIALGLYADIYKLSYLAPSFGFCDNEKLREEQIRKYNVKRYCIYYQLDELNKKVTVLRIRHTLQDENKFFRNV